MSHFFNHPAVQEDLKIRVQDRHFSAEEVNAKLQPTMENKRIERIERAVASRTLKVACVLEDLYDRGNVSAVMRSAEALGLQNIHLIQPTDGFKESARVTKGADKWLDTRIWRDSLSCVSHLKEKGYRICVTTLEGGQPIDEVDFSHPTAIVFGNERDGASPEMIEMADTRAYIPMRGFTQSFNISVAAALSFYHVMNLKKESTLAMSAQEVEVLTALYCMKSVESSDPILLEGE